MKDGMVHFVARAVMGATEALYERFGETIVLAALVSLAIVPFARRIFAPRNEDGVIALIINGLLFFASWGIAERAAYWAILQDPRSFELVVTSFVAGLIAAFMIWWCFSKLGDKFAGRMAANQVISIEQESVVGGLPSKPEPIFRQATKDESEAFCSVDDLPTSPGKGDCNIGRRKNA